MLEPTSIIDDGKFPLTGTLLGRHWTFRRKENGDYAFEGEPEAFAEQLFYWFERSWGTNPSSVTLIDYSVVTRAGGKINLLTMYGRSVFLTGNLTGLEFSPGWDMATVALPAKLLADKVRNLLGQPPFFCPPCGG